MVLPTVFNRSLICYRGEAGPALPECDRAANGIGQFFPRLKQKSAVTGRAALGEAAGDERYIIILVRERRPSRFFVA
jgi:hypothetical protein